MEKEGKVETVETEPDRDRTMSFSELESKNVLERKDSNLSVEKKETPSKPGSISIF
jgi:hypothetical protein